MFHYVYLLKSLKNPHQTYTGYTTGLKRRLEDHNSGNSVYTADARPWELVSCVYFKDKYQALEFEKYLKSHSGRLFAKKRLS